MRFRWSSHRDHTSSDTPLETFTGPPRVTDSVSLKLSYGAGAIGLSRSDGQKSINIASTVSSLSPVGIGHHSPVDLTAMLLASGDRPIRT
jgi:hypothetical protein